MAANTYGFIPSGFANTSYGSEPLAYDPVTDQYVTKSDADKQRDAYDQYWQNRRQNADADYQRQYMAALTPNPYDEQWRIRNTAAQLRTAEQQFPGLISSGAQQQAMTSALLGLQKTSSTKRDPKDDILWLRSRVDEICWKG